jgi:hypothetical protein
MIHETAYYILPVDYVDVLLYCSRRKNDTRIDGVGMLPKFIERARDERKGAVRMLCFGMVC